MLSSHVTSGEWTVLTIHIPKRQPTAIGILLREDSTDSLWSRFVPGWWQFLGEDFPEECWSEFESDLREQAQTQGAKAVLDWLADASHVMRTQARQPVRLTSTSAKAIVDALYEVEVAGTATRSRGIGR